MVLKTINHLIYYANKHLHLSYLDNVYKYNELLHFLNVDEMATIDDDLSYIDKLDRPDIILDHLIDELKENNLILPYNEETIKAQVMGILLPLPSETYRRFLSFKDKKEAIKDFYRLNIASYYVQATHIARNKKWWTKDNLVITINLSKPEKDNKDIRNALLNQNVTYPKCVLCYENEGFFGKGKFLNRKNIRLIPLKLNNEDWFMQYSPYGYYDEHLIVIKKHHEKMHINSNNLRAMFDFVEQFPFYFIGSNSDLPITGGSILSHEHFQGGYERMPLMLAKKKEHISLGKRYCDVDLALLDWPNTAFILESKDRNKLIQVIEMMNDVWLTHSDPKCDIIAYEKEERHNSITPLLEKKDDLYRFFIILRNNRTSKEYPEGIFHAHQEYYHIKKEGIGLIEASGYFILPGRLDIELPLVAKILANPALKEEYFKAYPALEKFAGMIEELKGSQVEDKNVLIKDYLADVIRGILNNTAVYKNDANGLDGLKRYLEKVKERLNDAH